MAQDAVDGKNILIVDDINDTGDTLAWIPNKIGKRQAIVNWSVNIRFATLVENEPG